MRVSLTAMHDLAVQMRDEGPMAEARFFEKFRAHPLGDLHTFAGFDRIRYKTFSIGSYTSEEEKEVAGRFLPTRDELKRHPTDIGRATCTTPLSQTVVFWNGDLGLCCIDYDQMVQLPNIETRGFLQAYLSDTAARARRKGFLKEFEICKGCSYSNAENMGFKIDLVKGSGLDRDGKVVFN